MSRRRLIVGVVTVALLLTTVAYVGAGLLEAPQESPTEAASPVDDQLVQPVDNGTVLWPFTSRSQSVDGRTLAVNVIVQGEPDEIRRTLTDRSDLGFEELPEDQEDAEGEAYQIDISETGVDWDDAHGSTRYSYMNTGENSRWMDESYQLYAGEYLGQRQHIRAYEDPEAEFAALQVHQEYFDFFRLRHVVTDIDDSAVMLEDEFIGEPFVEEVRREHHGLSGGWSDGWISVVELGSLNIPLSGLLGVLLVGSFATSSTRRAISSLGTNLGSWARENLKGFVLVAVLVVLVAGTRTLGIALERLVPDITPQLFAGAVYPILALGPPIAVALLARRLEPLSAFGFAIVGLGAAFTLDTIWVGLGAVPVRLVLHRVGLMLALGVIALGVARKVPEEGEEIEHERAVLIAFGVFAWFAGLVMPLFDMV